MASVCFKGALRSWRLKISIYSFKEKIFSFKKLVVLSNYTENEIGGAIKCLKRGCEKLHGEPPYVLHALKNISVAFTQLCAFLPKQ